MRDKVGFVLEFQRKKNELSIKGKKKLRSEEISQIARPKTRVSGLPVIN